MIIVILHTDGGTTPASCASHAFVLLQLSSDSGRVRHRYMMILITAVVININASITHTHSRYAHHTEVAKCIVQSTYTLHDDSVGHAYYNIVCCVS